VTRISLAATAAYLPERWMPAAEVALASGVPERVLTEKFALRGKHIAADGEHVSDMSVRVCETLLADLEVEPEAIDVVMYFGSMWKDYAVWQAAPWIAHRLGARASVLGADGHRAPDPAVQVADELLEDLLFP
jgi:3-oxoacyl-[acyl-carrier-protein] synthase-3